MGQNSSNLKMEKKEPLANLNPKDVILSLPKSGPSQPFHFDHFSFLIQNVWFDAHQKEARATALMREIEKMGYPMFIGLQETTSKFDSVVRSDPIIKHYHLTPYPVYRSYAVQMMIHHSILPFVRNIIVFSLESTMQRDFLLVELEIEGVIFAVGTVHLESLDSQKLRESQLKRIRDILSHYSHAVFGGDFNFCSWRDWGKEEDKPEKIENKILKELIPDYVDCYSFVYPKEKGYTFDTETNSMISHHRWERMRYDRIMLRSPDFEIQEIQIVNNSPFAKNVLISDHYGLLLKANKKKSSESKN